MDIKRIIKIESQENPFSSYGLIPEQKGFILSNQNVQQDVLTTAGTKAWETKISNLSIVFETPIVFALGKYWGVYTAGTRYVQIWNSTNLTSWTLVTTIDSGRYIQRADLVYGHLGFVIVCTQSLWSSTNGVDWVMRFGVSTPASQNTMFSRLNYIDGYYYYFTEDYWSNAVTLWKMIAFDNTVAISPAIGKYCDNYWVEGLNIVIFNVWSIRVHYSVDGGANYNTVNLPESNPVNSNFVGKLGSSWIIATNNYSYLASGSLSTWVKRTDLSGYKSIAYGNGYQVISALNSIIKVKGENIELESYQISNTAKVAYTNYVFLIQSESNIYQNGLLGGYTLYNQLNGVLKDVGEYGTEANILESLSVDQVTEVKSEGVGEFARANNFNFSIIETFKNLKIENFIGANIAYNLLLDNVNYPVFKGIVQNVKVNYREATVDCVGKFTYNNRVLYKKDEIITVGGSNLIPIKKEGDKLLNPSTNLFINKLYIKDEDGDFHAIEKPFYFNDKYISFDKLKFSDFESVNCEKGKRGALVMNQKQFYRFYFTTGLDQHETGWRHFLRVKTVYDGNYNIEIEWESEDFWRIPCFAPLDVVEQMIPMFHLRTIDASENVVFDNKIHVEILEDQYGSVFHKYIKSFIYWDNIINNKIVDPDFWSYLLLNYSVYTVILVRNYPKVLDTKNEVYGVLIGEDEYTIIHPYFGGSLYSLTSFVGILDREFDKDYGYGTRCQVAFANTENIIEVDILKSIKREDLVKSNITFSGSIKKTDKVLHAANQFYSAGDSEGNPKIEMYKFNPPEPKLVGQRNRTGLFLHMSFIYRNNVSATDDFKVYTTLTMALDDKSQDKTHFFTEIKERKINSGEIPVETTGRIVKKTWSGENVIYGDYDPVKYLKGEFVWEKGDININTYDLNNGFWLKFYYGILDLNGDHFPIPTSFTQRVDWIIQELKYDLGYTLKVSEQDWYADVALKNTEGKILVAEIEVGAKAKFDKYTNYFLLSSESHIFQLVKKEPNSFVKEHAIVNGTPTLETQINRVPYNGATVGVVSRGTLKYLTTRIDVEPVKFDSLVSAQFAVQDIGAKEKIIGKDQFIIEGTKLKWYRLLDLQNPVWAVWFVLKNYVKLTDDDIDLDSFNFSADQRKSWKCAYITEEYIDSISLVSLICKNHCLVLHEYRGKLVIAPVEAIEKDVSLFIPKANMLLDDNDISSITVASLDLSYVITGMKTSYGNPQKEVKDLSALDFLFNKTKKYNKVTGVQLNIESTQDEQTAFKISETKANLQTVIPLTLTVRVSMELLNQISIGKWVNLEGFDEYKGLIFKVLLEEGYIEIGLYLYPSDDDWVKNFIYGEEIQKDFISDEIEKRF